MRRIALSLLRITAAVAVLAMAGASLITQPLAGAEPHRGPRAQTPRLRKDVHALTTTLRPRAAENLDATAAYIERAFRESGARVELQEFHTSGTRNVIARFGPEKGPLTIVGAHYDAFCETGDLPGADDNASGTAGILELARLLGRTNIHAPVMLVAYANEEPPFFGSERMGSAAHARSIASEDVAGMICLEMIGYYAERQPWPNWTFAALYPSRGDFIAVAGGWPDRKLTRRVKRGLAGAGIRTRSFTGPRMTLDASDHRNYWLAGVPAVLVTDTGYIRNPHYHTRNDTAATLDYGRMARVVDGVFTALTSGGTI